MRMASKPPPTLITAATIATTPNENSATAIIVGRCRGSAPGRSGIRRLITTAMRGHEAAQRRRRATGEPWAPFASASAGAAAVAAP